MVNCLCHVPLEDTDLEAVDVNFSGNSVAQFDDAVVEIFAKLTSVTSNNGHMCPMLTKNSNGTYSVGLPSQLQLRFIHKDVSWNEDPINYVLHSSDLDISQLAWTGNTLRKKEKKTERSFDSYSTGSHVLCTFAFLQAVATKSFVSYTMHEDMDRSIYDRIVRYSQRGFVFLEPTQFDDQLYANIIAHTVSEDTVEESRQIMNDDGEIDTVVITYHPRRLPFPNVHQQNSLTRVRVDRSNLSTI